ncbi:hypothetical protein ACFQY0_00280 [Haloferula chungangensis]|uniref:SGNH/GDSL hydrolase family protein n=1 Tax=Haloferula chungangensis TaxID=1048331 RepID=A0ABW2L2Z2_9BACT
MQSSNRNAYRRHSLAFLGAVALIFLLSFLLNTFINPLWVTPAPWSSSDFADYKPIHKQPRTAKAGLALMGPWDGAIVGSSRVDIAINPRADEWNGARIVNLGLRGGNLCEFAPMIELASAHNDLKTILLGIDHYDLTSNVLIPNPSAFNESPLTEPPSKIERTLRYYLGGSSTTYSVKSINYRAKGRLASYDRLGQWTQSLDGRPFLNIFTTDSAPQAIGWVERSFTRKNVIQEKLDALRSILSICREKNIRLIVIIPPNHAMYQSIFFIGGAVDPTFQENRELILKLISESDREHPGAQPVDVWDFNDFHPLNCASIGGDRKAFLDNWLDGTHARQSIGDIILSRVFDQDTPNPEALPYGQKLTQDTLSQREEAIEAGYQRYRREQPNDWELSKSIMLELKNKEKSHPTADGGETEKR